MTRRTSVCALGVVIAALAAACVSPPPESEIKLVAAGQALIKKDPRIRWDDPYGSLRSTLDGTDIAFTNFEIGGYDEHRPWEGLIAEVIIRAGRVERIDFSPLDLDEGETYREDYDDLEFLSRRGLAQLASGPLAASILLRMQELSAGYGTDLTIDGSRATLLIESEN